MPEKQQVVITRSDKGSGTGWVVFAPCPDRPPPPDATPMFLEKAVARWLEEEPNVKVREMLGLVENGNTVGLQGWFD